MDWSKIVFNAGTVVAILIVLLPVIWKLWTANQKKTIETISIGMDSAFVNFNDKIMGVKDDLKHLRDMHEDHYEFQRLQIQKTTELEANLNNTIKALDKLYDQHSRNHNSNGKYNG